MRKPFFIWLTLFLLPAMAAIGQDTGTGDSSTWDQIQSKGLTAPLQSSNAFNPNISVVGTIVMTAGDDPGGPDADTPVFDLSEAEMAIQSVVDPYARADFFIAFHEDEVDMEEGFITWLKMPKGIQLKVGKFKAGLGKLNTLHAHALPFADRPLAAEAFLGEEGLAAAGVSLNYLFPTSFYLQGSVELTNIWAEAPAFGEDDGTGEIEKGGDRRDLGYLGRLETYKDFGDAHNVMAGLSYARGVHDPGAGELSSQLANLDVTYRWKQPSRAIYRSLLWRTELLQSWREQPGGGTMKAWGAFSYADWQFMRRWHVGARYDYTQMPDDDSMREKGLLAFVTFTPSEFSLVSLQGRSVRRVDGTRDNTAFLKVQFNIGPHGAHPF